MYIITPSKLLRGKSLTYKCDFAFVCYCPLPTAFLQYKIEDASQTRQRLFVHSHPSTVIYCRYGDINFLVISEIYGGPVSVTTVEELHYYGITNIIGIGFVGAFDDQLSLGRNIVGEKSLSESGTTPHYSLDEFLYPTSHLLNMFQDDNIVSSNIWTTNALYREYRSDVEMAISKGCSVVNMDTSHLYASASKCNMNCIYFATVSDVMSLEKEQWNNSLTDILDGENNTVFTGQTSLVEYIVSKLEYIRVINQVHSLTEKHNVCKSHDVNHIINVYKHLEVALQVDDTIPKLGEDRIKKLILYAGLLHDIDDNKFFPSNKNYENLRSILSVLNSTRCRFSYRDGKLRFFISEWR